MLTATTPTLKPLAFVLLVSDPGRADRYGARTDFGILRARSVELLRRHLEFVYERPVAFTGRRPHPAQGD